MGGENRPGELHVHARTEEQTNHVHHHPYRPADRHLDRRSWPLERRVRGQAPGNRHRARCLQGVRGQLRGQRRRLGPARGTVKAASVDTNEDARDAHLRLEDFFHAEVHPELAFESTEIRPLDEDTLEIHGELTMRGVTRPVVLSAELQGSEIDPWGNERVGVEVNGQLDRSDWGMTFNQALGSGNLLVSNKVKLSLDISAVKQA
jgi:polyisoprenoid-binding protein YceI